MNPITKSTIPFNKEDKGMIILGKYVFEINPALLMRLCVDEERPSEKKFQMNTPDNTKTG